MIYEYYCTKCDKVHEVQKKLKDLEIPEYCPDCKTKMAIKISAVPFIPCKGMYSYNSGKKG